jgi:hypothetical protein
VTEVEDLTEKRAMVAEEEVGKVQKKKKEKKKKTYC